MSEQSQKEIPVQYVRKTPSGDRPFGSSNANVTLILREAEELGIVWDCIPETNVFRLRHGGKVRYFVRSVPHSTLQIASMICGRKHWTKSVLKEAGLSVPRGYILTAQDPESYYQAVFDDLQKPLVVKPAQGMYGQHVELNIDDFTKFREIVKGQFSRNSHESSYVIVEEMFDGKEYRILTTPEKVIGAVYRVPANVVGDGKQSIKELIEEKNCDPRRGVDHRLTLEKIIIDDRLNKFVLEKYHYKIDDVPELDQQIFLRNVSNISQGGDSIDVTDDVHQSVFDLAIRCVQAIPGLSFAGVDFMTRDISKPQNPNDYVVLEVNTSPHSCMHDVPYIGQKRGAAQEFLFLMFPELRNA